ncbi:MAG: flippase [Endomicrobia bacterium]|nr:flippase [Endomicrobiia bacterium]
MIEYIVSAVTNIGIQILAKIPESLLSLFTLMMITRNISIEDYGIYSFAVAYITMFSPLCDMGMTPIITREVSIDKQKGRFLIGTATILRMFMVAVYIGIIIITTFTFKEPVKRFVVIGLLLSFLTYPLTTVNSVFYSELKIWWLSIGNILRKIIFLGLFSFLSMFKLGLISVVISYVLSENLTNLFLFVVGLRYILPIYKFDIGFAKFLLKQSLPLFLTILISMFYTKVDTVMLSFLTVNATVGMYNAAVQFYSFMFFVAAVIGSVFFPLMSKLYNSKQFLRVAIEGIIVSLIAGLFILVVVLIAGEPLMLFVLPKKYLDAIKILKVLCIGIPFAFISIILGDILIIIGKQNLMFIISFLSSTVNILLNFILIPKFFSIGAALATSLTQIFSLVVYSFLILKFLPMITGDKK